MIVGDPHFTGFLGQTYDVTGEPGQYYSIISDSELAINARFEQAYTDRYGGSIDQVTGEQLKYQARGTWMTWLSLLVPNPTGGVNHVIVNVEDSLARLECTENCMLAGTVILDGNYISKKGNYSSGALDLQVTNSKSYTRNVIRSAHCEVSFDVVLPPAPWKIEKDVQSKFSHLNMKFYKIDLTESAHGLMGLTSRMKTNAYGEPITKAYDKNGSGILDGTYKDYEITDILSTDFTYSRFMTLI